jgi:hypothetical protein
VYDYFGLNPVSVLLQTTNQFDGAAFSEDVQPSILAGIVMFPAQAGGGRIDFHKRPLKILAVWTDILGATGKMILVFPNGTEMEIKTLQAGENNAFNGFVLPVGASLKFTTSGGSAGTKKISIVAVEMAAGMGI